MPALSSAALLGPDFYGPPVAGLQVPHSLCYAPGTSAAKIQAIQKRYTIDTAESLVYSPFRVRNRWTRTATNGAGLGQGTPTTLTYSFVPDGVAIPGDTGETNRLQAFLNGLYGSPATWQALFAQATASWSRATGVTYVYEPKDDGATFPDSPGALGVRGDVRIAGHFIDGPGSGILAYNSFPDFGDMVIDTGQTDFYADKSNNSLGLRNVVTHEMGHGLGLSHVCPLDETKLMEPLVSTRYSGPQFDDVSAIQRSYGDRLERNNSSETATNLGALKDGTVTRDELSIDSNKDTDFFQFSAPINKSVSITVRPEGAPYLEGPQVGDCTNGELFDPRNISNLGFELLSQQNNTYVPFRTINNAPAGGTETLDAVNLPSSGPFQIRVFGGDNDALQRYSIAITIDAPVANPTPGPTPTAGPAPTPGLTPFPTAVPTPSPTPIRPIVDLNGPNNDGSTGQDSPVANGIDNESLYFYQLKGAGMPAGPQIITPPETIVLSDISSGPVTPGDYIVEARVQLTPQVECGFGQGRAPDNCNVQNKRDNEVLAITPGEITFLNNVASGITVSYNNETQILTLQGANKARYNPDTIRFLYEDALQNVTYENKLPIPNSPFARNPRLDDRAITYVVDTDNIDDNNQDNRFAAQEPGNPKQSKPATLTLHFVELQSLVVTTLRDSTTFNPLDDPVARIDGQTSLREAIRYANSIPLPVVDPNATTPPPPPPPPSVITFLPNLRGTINLQNPLPVVGDPANAPRVQIAGPGARAVSVVSASNSFRIFEIQGDSAISGLTIANGKANASSFFGFDYGGGILNNGGNLTISACMITGNQARVGGGVANLGGNLTIDQSTINGNNSSGPGGGVYLDNFFQSSPSLTTISNSTISANSGGSGIYIGSGSATLSRNTITLNSQAGITVGSGQNNRATVDGSIISGNTGNRDVVFNGNAANNPFASGGYNIVGAGNGAALFTGAGDRIGIVDKAAGLATLGNNGGNTDTHALFAGSPAIDAGNPDATTAPATDQRGAGFPRVFGAASDIGSFEKQNANAVINAVISPRNPGTNDTLTANANSDSTNLNYAWSVNGALRQSGPRNTFDLSRPGFGDRGQTISVVITDSTETPAQSAARVGNTDAVVVGNIPPSFTLAIAPNSPTTNQSVTVTPTSTDGDNDPLTYTYQWSVTRSVNGNTVTSDLPGETSRTLNLSKQGNGDRDETVTVTVTASDGADTTQGTASVVVANSAPSASNIAFSVDAGKTVKVLLRGTDPDVNDKLSFSLASNPTKGTASIDIQDGRYVLTYTANADATGTDTLTFTATDNNTAPAGAPSNSLSSAPATATITITGTPTATPTPGGTPGPTPIPGPTPTATPDPNRPPVAASTSLNAKREVPVSKALAASDPDRDDVYSTLTLVRVSGPRKGTGEIRKDTDGVWKLFYKASGLYTGNDEVQFVAVDSKGAVSERATITINLFNTAPTARSTQMQVAAGGSGDVGIFGQDIDRDAITFKLIKGAKKGTGEIRKDKFGNFRFYYQNSTVAVGDDQVQFVAVDSNGATSELATIDIKVVGVFNRNPSAQNVTGTTVQDTPVAVAVSGTDPDEADLPADQPSQLTFKRVGGPVNGTGEIRKDEDGVFKMFYTPRRGFVGTEVIRYVAVDPKGAPSAPATITITVTASGSSAITSRPAPSGGSS